MKVALGVLLYLREEGCGIGSSTEEGVSVPRIEVLGGTHSG